MPRQLCSTASLFRPRLPIQNTETMFCAALLLVGGGPYIETIIYAALHLLQHCIGLFRSPCVPLLSCLQQQSVRCTAPFFTGAAAASCSRINAAIQGAVTAAAEWQQQQLQQQQALRKSCLSSSKQPCCCRLCSQSGTNGNSTSRSRVTPAKSQVLLFSNRTTTIINSSLAATATATTNMAWHKHSLCCAVRA